MSSFKLTTILAVLGLIFFVAVVTLQVLELKHYNDEPSVWVAQGQ